MKYLTHIFAVAVGVMFMALSAPPATAAAEAAPAAAQQTGFAVKRPVLGGACNTCPWGAIADVIKPIMAPRGWDIQNCYNCSGQNSVRLVSAAGRPNQPSANRSSLPNRNPPPPPPNGPVDFGVTNLHRLLWAYEGIHDYRNDPPMRNLRLIGFLEHPMYIGVAVSAASGITDLRQIKERRMPVRVIADANPYMLPILEYYGITEEELKSWGGSIVEEGQTGTRPEFDVIIHNQVYLANTPESNVWYEITQTRDLRFLQLPEDLLAKLATDLRLERVTMPAGVFRNQLTPIAAVGRSGQVVYGRADMPDAFAYDMAKAMDEDRRAFLWTNMPLSYNSQTACKALGVPIHPGAARYCREKGYPQ